VCTIHPYICMVYEKKKSDDMALLLSWPLLLEMDILSLLRSQQQRRHFLKKNQSVGHFFHRVEPTNLRSAFLLHSVLLELFLYYYFLLRYSIHAEYIHKPTISSIKLIFQGYFHYILYI